MPKVLQRSRLLQPNVCLPRQAGLGRQQWAGLQPAGSGVWMVNSRQAPAWGHSHKGGPWQQQKVSQPVSWFCHREGGTGNEPGLAAEHISSPCLAGWHEETTPVLSSTCLSSSHKEVGHTYKVCPQGGRKGMGRLGQPS